jgi:hypothetical protein
VRHGVTPGAPASENGEYVLRTSLLQTTRVGLTHTYDQDRIPAPTSSRVTVENGNELAIRGVFLPADVTRILLQNFAGAVSQPAEPLDAPQEEAAFAEWCKTFYTTRRVARRFNLGSLAAKLDFPGFTPREEIPAILRDRLTLDIDGASWRGTISNRELQALLDFGNSLPAHRVHRPAVLGLEQKHRSHSADLADPYLLTTRPLSQSELPEILRDRLTIHQPSQPGGEWELVWSGTINSDQIEALKNLPGDSGFLLAVQAIVLAIPDEGAASFTKASKAPFREPVRRVQKKDLEELFEASDIEPLQIPTDLGFHDGPPETETNLVWQWRRHAPLPLPAHIYKDRVRDKFSATNQRFVEIFGLFMDRVDDAVRSLERTAEEIVAVPIPAFLRCRTPLSSDEVIQLRQSSNADPEVEKLIRDVEDRRALEAIANDWFSTTAVSQPLANVPGDIPSGLVDFPEPSQCTLVWKGGLSAEQREQLRVLHADAGFDAAIGEILEARPESLPESIRDRLEILDAELRWIGPPPTAQQDQQLDTIKGDSGFALALQRLRNSIPENAPAKHVTKSGMSQFLTGLAPAGLDQVPARLKSKIEITTGNGRHTGLKWVGSTPMLDEDLLAMRQWPAMASLETELDGIAHFEVALDAEAASPKPAPRPVQQDLRPVLGSKLTIEPLKLTWTGRLHDASELDMLRDLRGDASFNAAVQSLIQFLDSKPEVVFQTSIPARPQQDSLAEPLKNNLLIGRASIRYHGIMTPEEGVALKNAYTHQADKDAVARLFDLSMSKGLQGSQLVIRTRRGSAAPSEMTPLEAEELA